MNLFPRVVPLCALLTFAAHAAEDTAWVAKSNAHARVLFKAIGQFHPEQLSGNGLKEYDPYVVDLTPGADDRESAALSSAIDELKRALANETDAAVRQDLQIMIGAAQRDIDDIAIRQRYLLPFEDVSRRIFQGEFQLLNPEASADRQAAAVTRLRRYVGLEPGTKGIAELAQQRFQMAAGDPKLLGPFRAEVEQSIANTERYAQGIRKLFTDHHLSADDALAELDRQLTAFRDWMQKTVLPRARADYRVPREVYANQLRQVGLDIDPEQLIAKAQLEFSEVTAEMQSLAPLVAREHGWPESDYREVIRRLKKDQLKPDAVEHFYRTAIIPKLEAGTSRRHLAATGNGHADRVRSGIGHATRAAHAAASLGRQSR